MEVHADQLKEFAEELASRAAHLVWTDRLRAAGGPIRGARRTPTGLISPAALGAERLIKELIWEQRPGDGVLGRQPVTPGQLTWVVDPLNGEANYAGGLPGYAVSVAAMLDDVVLAGAVAEPHSRRVWSAGLGQGARLHDRMISDNWLELEVSSAERLDASVVSAGFSPATSATAVVELVPQIGGLRCSGSPVLDLVHVAAGWTDAHVEHGAGVRECAAGLLISEEAGATVCWPGRDHRSSGREDLVLASTPRIFDAVREALDRAAAGEVSAEPRPTLTTVRPRHTA